MRGRRYDITSACSMSKAHEFGLARIHFEALHRDLERSLTLDHKCNPQ